MTAEIVHRIRERGSDAMPCCGQVPWLMPGADRRTMAGSWQDPATGVWHRQTANPYEATCGRPTEVIR